MKILHVIAQLPSRTGSGVYYSNVIEELKKYGHHQAALFSVQDDFPFDVVEKNAQYPVCFKSERIPFPIAGMSDVMPYESTVYSEMNEEMLGIWFHAFEEALTRARDEFNPEVVILHHLWMLTSMATKIFIKQLKIGICHNTDIRQAEQHPDMKNKYVTNLHSLDAVFSLSEAQRQTITDVFGIERHRIIAMGGGFNQNLFYPPECKEKNEKTRIVFAAKIEKSKGVFELVKAFKKLSETNPNAHLDIIGQPNTENAIALNTLMEGTDNITVLPISNQKVLADYIRDKDIFVMPSYFEGLGLMAIECLASGLRVVATEIEALMNLLGEGVNDSGVIEYVKLPRIYDTDKPYDEDLEMFVEALAYKLLLQVERVEKGYPFPKEILFRIDQYSWFGIVDTMNQELYTLLQKKRLDALDVPSDNKWV